MQQSFDYGIGSSLGQRAHDAGERRKRLCPPRVLGARRYLAGDHRRPEEAFQLHSKPQVGGGHVDGVVRCYFTEGTPRSLQIFRAKSSSISLCLGTEDRLFWLGLCHQECLPPSRRSLQP